MTETDGTTDLHIDPESKSPSSKNTIYKPKRKYPGFRKNFANYIQEYTDYTGIHGFKYMGEQDRSWVERLWWLVLFCISLYFCIELILQTWIKWDTSPVLVSFARSPTPVWQVPFPAITICSETKSKQTVFNFTKNYNDYRFNNPMTSEELDSLEDMSLLCENHLVVKGKKITEFSSIEKLVEKAPQFDDTLFSCKMALHNESCYDMFTPILTEEGLCFTFNMLNRNELLRNKTYLHGNYMQHGRLTDGWTLEDGYPKSADVDTFPRRALSAGYSAGLYLVLKANKSDLDYICRGPVQGFKILLHHPAELPRVGMQYFRAPLNTEVVASIKPDMMTTSPGLRSYDPHRRQCYFPTERYLAYFQSYTQQNCQVECLRNYTEKRCGCVAFHMPHEKNTTICGSGSQFCMFEAQTEVLTREVEAGITHFDSLDVSRASDDCDCLPACTSLSYNAEISQADYDWETMFDSFLYNYTTEMPGVQLTRLTLFFKEQQFITSERNELYGQTDFLANCGGILGLFTGFSFLSIVEILYFLSLRLMCNVKMYGRRYWSGSGKLINNDAYVHDK